MRTILLSMAIGFGLTVNAVPSVIMTQSAVTVREAIPSSPSLYQPTKMLETLEGALRELLPVRDVMVLAQEQVRVGTTPKYTDRISKVVVSIVPMGTRLREVFLTGQITHRQCEPRVPCVDLFKIEFNQPIEGYFDVFSAQIPSSVMTGMVLRMNFTLDRRGSFTANYQFMIRDQAVFDWLQRGHRWIGLENAPAPRDVLQEVKQVFVRLHQTVAKAP
jgi:hypothetical protein